MPDDFQVGVARDGQVAWRYWGIKTDYLLPAQQGIFYFKSLEADLQPEAYPYHWQIPSGEGSLPAGLELTDSGTILGTPTAGGGSAFRVLVTDNNNVFRATRLFILIVLPSKVPGQLVSE